MKILAIIGTPTRDQGLTWRAVQALQQSLQSRSAAEVAYLYLEDAGLTSCQGYLTCIKHGEAQCPFSTAVSSVLARMEQADAVIFASPVHIFNVSALMKTLFDLLVFQMHRPSFFGKPAAVVTVGAGAGMGKVLRYMSSTVGNWGFEVAGKLGVHGGLLDDPRYAPKLTKAADKIAAALLRQIADGRPRRPGIADLINFRVWRAVVRRTAEASPYDWEHWQSSGWLQQNYYYATPVNPLSNLLAGLIERLINRAISKASVKPLT